MSQADTRFFIALLPPSEVQAYANTVIQNLGDRYNTRTSKSPPHITLQPPFFWQGDNTTPLEDRLRQFAQTQPTVPVTLSGFGAFAPRVLYINVLKTPELMALQAHLKTTLETTLDIKDPKAKGRAFAPHLTVASRRLNRAIFKKIWAELEPRQVEFNFWGDRLTLLIHDGQRWQIHSEYELTATSTASTPDDS